MFDAAAFKALFPAFNTLLADETIEAVAVMAECYLNKCGKCYDQLLMLLVAHMLKLRQSEADGDNVGNMTSASVDGVSVSFTAPPSSASESAYWFGLTPYGQQFLALNKRCSGVPRYVGGSGERAAFRGVGGRFPNGSRSW